MTIKEITKQLNNVYNFKFNVMKDGIYITKMFHSLKEFILNCGFEFNGCTISEFDNDCSNWYIKPIYNLTQSKGTIVLSSYKNYIGILHDFGSYIVIFNSQTEYTVYVHLNNENNVGYCNTPLAIIGRLLSYGFEIEEFDPDELRVTNTSILDDDWKYKYKVSESKKIKIDPYAQKFEILDLV